MEIPLDQANRTKHVREWVCNRIREFRNAKGWTQTDLADRMSVHYTRICDLEANRSDYKASTVFRSCAAMGIPMEKFFQGCPDWKGRKESDVSLVFRSSALVEKLCDQGYDRKEATDVVKLLANESRQ